MYNTLLILLLIFIFGCGKPLAPYSFDDALQIKKFIMHKRLGNLSQQTSDKISKLRLDLQNGTISSTEFEDKKKIIKDDQQNQIKKLQNNFNKYKADNIK